MNKENLIKEKEQLEQQREQTIAQLNQIIGALVMVDKYIKEVGKEELVDTKEIKEPKEDK